MRRALHVLAAASALFGLPVASAPAPTTAVVQGQQSKNALPSERVSKRAIKQQFIIHGVSLRPVGGTKPWVNRHGYLLRQVSRPMPRSIR